MAVELSRHRFTVDEYYWIARVGILAADDRVELIDGEIVEIASIGPHHAASVRQCTECFVRQFSDLAHVSVQSPIRLDTYDEPEPDLALVRRRADSYRLAHPAPEDVFLVVEVADTSLAADRRIKLLRYAQAGIVEVWLVDLPHHVVYVHREPAADGYRLARTARRGERIAPLAFPDREIAVADLLG